MAAATAGAPDLLPGSQPAWAHMSLRMVDWVIRRFPADELNQWVDW
ncbi:MAG TPA: hypothetical protein VFU65_21455 [Actinocrinis sp.]|nr:hypothetical protein [Actinocrinis sp.]